MQLIYEVGLSLYWMFGVVPVIAGSVALLQVAVGSVLPAARRRPEVIGIAALIAAAVGGLGAWSYQHPATVRRLVEMKAEQDYAAKYGPRRIEDVPHARVVSSERRGADLIVVTRGGDGSFINPVARFALQSKAVGAWLALKPKERKPAGRLLVWMEVDVVDAYGKPAKASVLSASWSRAVLDKIYWDSITSAALLSLAEVETVHPLIASDVASWCMKDRNAAVGALCRRY